MSYIVPKSKAPRVDFCGVDNYSYIIRSDLGVFMRASNFNKGRDLEVYSLHQSCKGGDHYLACSGGDHHYLEFPAFYIIKGNSYRRVTNMKTDSDSVTFSLHKNCQGGDHYLSAYGGWFYIIFNRRGVYRKTSNMNKDSDAFEFPLHESCKGGLYYWGTKDNSYFLKPKGKWGIEYHRTNNLNKDQNSIEFSIHDDVVNFLPGGLAMTMGKSFGKWALLKTIDNRKGISSLKWKKSISKKEGYNKSVMSSIEYNWNGKLTGSYGTGDLAAKFAKYQFSLEAAFGGKAVNTTNRFWERSKTEVEELEITVPKGGRSYIWQFKLGMGDKDVLFCRDIMVTNSLTTPTEIPLRKQ